MRISQTSRVVPGSPRRLTELAADPAAGLAAPAGRRAPFASSFAAARQKERVKPAPGNPSGITTLRGGSSCECDQVGRE